MPQNIELWVLGDFNTDFLVRDNDSTKKLTSYLRSIGLYQLINQITRPGIHKGTCIDWKLTNSPFVKHSGSSYDLISDHLAVFAVRKKDRENTKCIYRTVRDVSNYNKDIFVDLLRNYDWDTLKNNPNPDAQCARSNAISNAKC